MALEHSQQHKRSRVPKKGMAARGAAVGGRPVVIGPGFLLSLAAVLATGWFLFSIRGVLVTLLLAGAVAFVGGPLVSWLEARRVPRGAGTALYLLGLLLLLVLLSLLVIPTLVRELGALIQRLPEAVAALEAYVESATGVHIPRNLSELSAQLSDDVLKRAAELLKGNTKAVQSGAAGLFSAAATVFGAAGQTVLVPVLAFFLLVEAPTLRAFVLGLVPGPYRTTAGEATNQVREALTKLIRGQLTVALLMTVIYAVGLSLFGVPLALAIAIIAGFGYIIPFASATLCVLLSTTFVLLEVRDGMWIPLIGAAATAGFTQLIEGWVLTPRIVGESAGLSPLAVILSVLVFGTLFDFLGVLFALPLATVIGVLLERRAKGPSLGLVMEAA